MNFSKKEKEEARKMCAAADIAMAYDFRHPHYTHNGCDEPTHRSEFRLIPTKCYVIVDGNCESHFVPFYARFVKGVERGRKFLNTKDFLLFRALEDGTCHKKDDYFLVLPNISLDRFEGTLRLELTAEHHLGPSPHKKIVVREAEAF